MALVDRWRRIQTGLPDGWRAARVRISVRDPQDVGRATALLAPAGVFRRDETLQFDVHRGRQPSVEHVARLLRKLDDERIAASLDAVVTERDAPAGVAAPTAAVTLAEGWDAALAELPDDWSDLFVEVELRSSDYLEGAALAMSPLNPSSFGDRQGLRFRCARLAGYGASPGMARACFGRCDAAGVRGTVRVLRALSDTDQVQTQGPVWHVGGRTV